MREDNSRNGNPRYRIAVRLLDGETVMGMTKSDVMWAYNMPRVDTLVDVVIRETREGLVFESVLASERTLGESAGGAA